MSPIGLLEPGAGGRSMAAVSGARGPISSPWNSRRRRLLLGLYFALLVGLIVWLLWVFEVGPYVQNGFLPGASGFVLTGPVSRVPPGAIGCRAISGNLCYSAWFITAYRGRSVGDLRWNVGNASDPQAPPLPLGPGAEISVLNPTGGVLATWNVSAEAWSAGATAILPQNVQVPVVLDTGLLSNSTLSNAMLWGALEGQGSGVNLIPG
ncbi:MAG TPA: hypothetical protein VFG07_05370 [Thermoplasmata archaeon]|nr:hypothetical protein [Thermoplasmata archaeon]